MRFKSKTVGNYCVYAITGTNTVSFGIDHTKADTKGLLGFSVKRTYPDGEHFMPGFKEFKANEEKISEDFQVSTETDPVQSFIWDDFTLKPGQKYTYTFFPVKGSPGALERRPWRDPGRGSLVTMHICQTGFGPYPQATKTSFRDYIFSV